MRSSWMLLLCVVSAVALASCKTSAPPPASDEPEAETTDESAKVEAPTVASTAAEGIPAPSDVAAPPEDAERTPSGLASKVLKKGKGDAHPGLSDLVTVNYTGWTTDGTLLDSSIPRGEPIQFPLNGTMPGWKEGVQLMVQGETRRLWIPAALALEGRPGTPQGMLVFDVELVSFIEGPKAPKDVAKIPKNAKRTESGLASRVLKKGTGTKHPGPTSTVTINFSCWTPDGALYRSSFLQGKPAQFPLNETSLAGWKEGLPLMVVGEKRRFWIPGELALGGFVSSVPNAPSGLPQGMLVFDVELLDIQ